MIGLTNQNRVNIKIKNCQEDKSKYRTHTMTKTSEILMHLLENRNHNLELLLYRLLKNKLQLDGNTLSYIITLELHTKQQFTYNLIEKPCNCEFGKSSIQVNKKNNGYKTNKTKLKQNQQNDI